LQFVPAHADLHRTGYPARYTSKPAAEHWCYISITSTSALGRVQNFKLIW